MHKLVRLGLALSLTFAAACDSTMTASEAMGPQIGKADGMDRADHDCRVVLRDVMFKPGSPYTTRDGWIVWEGRIDVAPDAFSGGTEVGLLYRRAGRDWYEVTATPAGTSVDGMAMFHFEMYDGISTGGEGGLNWQQMKIEVIPFLRLDDGSRIFDHNANTNDLQNYQLDYSWGPGRTPFELRVDPTVC